MTAPNLTPSERAAFDRGAEKARAACADIAAPTITDVTLDRGGMVERVHIGWCLLCQSPAARCACDNAEAAEALVEDDTDVQVDVAAVLAETREQLQLHADAAAELVDVAVAGERL